MKKSTKNVIGIIAGIAVATASAIFLGKNAKSEKSESNDSVVEFAEVVNSDEAFEEVV